MLIIDEEIMNKKKKKQLRDTLLVIAEVIKVLDILIRLLRMSS